MSELGTQFLVDDLRIAQEPVPGMSSFPLGDSSGFGGYAVWTPSRPGESSASHIRLEVHGEKNPTR